MLEEEGKRGDLRRAPNYFRVTRKLFSGPTPRETDAPRRGVALRSGCRRSRVDAHPAHDLGSTSATASRPGRKAEYFPNKRTRFAVGNQNCSAKTTIAVPLSGLTGSRARVGLCSLRNKGGGLDETIFRRAAPDGQLTLLLQMISYQFSSLLSRQLIERRISDSASVSIAQVQRDASSSRQVCVSFTDASL